MEKKKFLEHNTKGGFLLDFSKELKKIQIMQRIEKLFETKLNKRYE